MSGAFSSEVRDLKGKATRKAKNMVERITGDLRKLFELEYEPIVE